MANYSDALVCVTFWKNGEQVEIPRDGVNMILETSHQNEGTETNKGEFYLTGRWSYLHTLDSMRGEALLQWLLDNDYERVLFDFAEIEQDIGFVLHGTLNVSLYKDQKSIHVISESVEWKPDVFNLSHLYYPFPTIDEDDEYANYDAMNEAYDLIQSTIRERYVGKSSPQQYTGSDGTYAYNQKLIQI